MTQVQERAAGGGFAAALHAAVERMRDASEAEIVALYPYNQETGSFYAPVAVGLPGGDVIHGLPDVADQLRRFRVDQEQGKVPEDVQPSHYGPSAWLLHTRRPLVSTDATHDVEGTFVRRHKIRSIVGLPLSVGDRLVGVLYLNYVDHDGQAAVDVTAPTYLDRIQVLAGEVALALDAARQAEETRILRALSDLASQFAALPAGGADEFEALKRLEVALERVLAAAHLDAAALYAPDTERSGLKLLASHGCPQLAALAAFLPTAPSPGLPDVGERAEDVLHAPSIAAALEKDGLYPVTALNPHGEAKRAVLLLADRDKLALQRCLPVTETLLQTAADLLGGMLTHERLIDALGESNRTLGAVTRLSNRLLQAVGERFTSAPQEQVLRTAVDALTDPALPELDFEFAAFFLLDNADTANGEPEDALVVAATAGATSSPSIDAVPDEVNGRSRVPRWVTSGRRVLDQGDIVGYVATKRRAVVVAGLDAPEDTHFVTGYPEDRLERFEIPITHSDGKNAGTIRAVRLREAADRAPLRGDGDQGGMYHSTTELTLNADLFFAHGHSSLVRVFMPFGSDITSSGQRAMGVLEAGYHISRKQRLERVQIEALRACAATLAIAVETARLYEDVTSRARQLEMVTDVSRAIAASIDLDQTLGLVARNMARAVDTSICLIALLDEDGSAWYGAAASDMHELWRQRRVERPEPSIVFEVADRCHPVTVENALDHELISGYMARLLGIRSLMALPLTAGDEVIGAVLLGQRDRHRVFTEEEIERASGLAGQAAMAIRNARLHAREEEEQHIQKDVLLIGFGQWGRKAYKHLLILKSFFNFRMHVVEADLPGRREALAEAEREVLANGDLFYWDSPASPARNALALELEPSCYVITYIATPAETHLPVLRSYYDLSNVVLIEKPLGAPPEEYREFLDSTDGTVQIVAADHYWFKTEVRLLALLLSEERNLRAFLDEIEEVEIEILEGQPPGGSGAQIGMIADLIPHAFAILSLLTPLDRLKLDEPQPLHVGRYQPVQSEHETYARLCGSFDHHGRQVRVTIEVGKGVADAKWIKLIGPRRMGGRRSFYKFDFAKGEAIDGTQSALRAAMRPIRQPGVPDNAHLSMLRHVIEKKHPAVGILSIREALRANARIQALEHMAADMIEAGQWTPYEQGQRPAFVEHRVVRLPQMEEGQEVGAKQTGSG